MVNINEKDKRAFLRALTKLSKRYKIGIIGCGCCGSPSLYPMRKTNGKYDVAEDNTELEFEGPK